MGLGRFIGKVGKEWSKEAQGFNGNSLGSYLGGPPVMAGIGGAVGGGAGAAFGAAGTPEDPLGGAGRGAMMAGLPMAGMMGGMGVLASGSMAARQLIVAIAQALKKEMPDISDYKAIVMASKHPDVEALMRQVNMTLPNSQKNMDPKIQRAMDELFSRRPPYNPDGR